MGTYLRMRLVVPLLGISSVAIFLHTRWEAGGFFLNLATELIGILVTIGYVDWILRHHEKQKWLSTDIRVSNRLRNILNATVSSLRRGLGFTQEVFDERVMRTGDPIAIHNEIIRVAEHVITPILLQRVRTLDQNGWKSLTTQIQSTSNAVTNRWC
jgi:hypothetical protein